MILTVLITRCIVWILSLLAARLVIVVVITSWSCLLLDADSKCESERELQLPCCIGCRGDASHPTLRDDAGRNLELRMIEHVKELRAKQERGSFRDRELLLGR